MRAVLAALAMVAGASGAQAATVTFDGMGWMGYGGSWVEDGITATGIGGTLGAHGLPGEAHLDDGGTHFASAISFTMDGRFDAVGLDIGPSSSAAYYCETPATPFGDGDCDPFAFENVQVVGFRDNTQVALSTFDMFAVGGHYAFGSEFTNLDSLVIGFAARPTHYWFASFPGAGCFDNPCTHFDIDIDNVTLATPSRVPLPASATLMLTALAGLAGLAWRLRRHVQWAALRSGAPRSSL